MWALFANTIDGTDNGSYDHMMGSNWSNTGSWFMVWMFIFMVLIIAGVVYLLVRISKGNTPIKTDDPMTILKTRYAKGEVTKKQFDEMRKDISAHEQ